MGIESTDFSWLQDLDTMKGDTMSLQFCHRNIRMIHGNESTHQIVIDPKTWQLQTRNQGYMVKGSMHQKLHDSSNLCQSILNLHSFVTGHNLCKGLLCIIRHRSILATLDEGFCEVRVTAMLHDWDLVEFEVKKLGCLQPQVINIQSIDEVP